MKFDAEKRSKFFDDVFSKTQEKNLESGATTILHSRDHIFFRALEKANSSKIFDYGAGQGRLLDELLKRGFDAYGYEPSSGMTNYADTHGSKNTINRLVRGNADQLAQIPANSFDHFLLMGVLQYLSPEERENVFATSRKFLKKNGTIVCTFQNALFDLFTLNKYTSDAFADTLLDGEIDSEQKDEVRKEINSLLVKNSEPAHSDWRARDNIYVALDNPLTIREYMSEQGYSVDEIHFYDWFPLPPLLMAKFPDVAKRIKEKYEVRDSQNWRGHFMSNAFLVVATAK